MKRKKIAFLDRDGVINKKQVEHHYVTTPSEFHFNEGIFAVLQKLRDDGFEFIVVTNQRGICRGHLDEQILLDIHNKMCTGLRNAGIVILDIFYCPHDNNECNCRKPKTGLLKQATAKYDIDVHSSLLISDSHDDIDMAEQFGIQRRFLVPHDVPEIVLDIYTYNSVIPRRDCR